MISLTTGMMTLNPTNTAQDEDQLLIHSFLGGDEAAFSTLVEKYRRQVYAVAWRYTRNHEESDDLSQETFVKAYQHLKGFRKESSFKTWLLRITTNLSLNLIKSGRISKDSGEEIDEGLTHQESGALHGMLSGEREAMLQRAIAQLPPKQKQTLLLKTFRDLTCQEVATIMNCSVGTVKANVFNALKRLKSLLVPEQGV